MRIQSKWIILQLTSLLCYITLFPAVFSAVPLAIFRLSAPRNFYYGFLGSTNILLYMYFGLAKAEGLAFAFGYTLVCFWGTLASELLLKYYSNEAKQGTKKNFWKYYLGIGLVPLVAVLALTLSMLKTNLEFQALHDKAKVFSQKILSEPSTLEVLKELKKSTSPEAEQVISLLENPDLFASQLLFAVPSYFIIGYFVLAFFTVFFLARLQHFTNISLAPEWVHEVVAEYRNSDIFIGLGIAILAWALFYQELNLSTFWQQHAGILGSSLINIIGVFFFFQGLTVCLHLFDRWGIKGFLGAVILFVVLLVALKAVAVLGLIDMWLDIRRKKLGFGSNKSEK